MKKINIYTLIIISLLFTSCNDFLDVKQKGNATENEMFSDVQGYREAMYGVYASLAAENLYGAKLSYGFADELAQLYKANTVVGEDYFNEAINYKYKDKRIVDIKDAIWNDLYAVISYVNNIIYHAEKSSFKSDVDMQYILGEAYALRAFMHFDIVRYFADNYIISPDAGGIPYSFDFNLKNRKVFSLKDTYKNIIADLDRGEAILEKYDLSLASNSIYQSDREMNMNVYALYAIKARVFHTMGDVVNAAKYAEKVINSKKFKLGVPSNFDKIKRFPAKGEMIWGLYNNKIYDILFKTFISNVSSTRRMLRSGLENMYETTSFTSLSTDIRYQKYFSGNVFIRILEKEAKPDEDKYSMIQGVTLIRLPELMYIAAEGIYDTDKDKAVEYLNEVRRSRGLDDLSATKTATKDLFIDEVKKERFKEFYGEGQTFLYYKRNNDNFMNIYNQVEIKASTDIFVLPWPDLELEYGLTNKKQ